MIQIVREYSQISITGACYVTYELFPRDFELNEVCMDVCVEEALTCIINCDPTDSECTGIITCLRAETTCAVSNGHWNQELGTLF